ncbi:hypothetical protein SAMN02800694_1427 [Luteibacter sp. UNCMF331Sha3.1]|uniref:hypothetical protein n=1 Tax=Luteibacter sp. UNCMF331Sha3.1 TaxID=1502760 RepID=UPI0008D16721|nr:hypothetical protein [Luteibacter sp. UNCMF331Sha3.1]SEM53634.1 hypothetical protein SAMN02800694_1427 [Luteibacter sp. UNCMF331Sha3.1]
MITAVFIYTGSDIRTAHVEEAPLLVERDGLQFSLQAPPRVPQPNPLTSEPVAVYALDDETEEEFQDLFELAQKNEPLLRLKY